MWQRFTERARKVVFFAQEEAQRFGEGYVSTEHLLLGLTREDDSVAVRVLTTLSVDRMVVRKEVERQLPEGDFRTNQDMSLTPRAKRVIDLAYDEARNLSNNYIGTEHLLLGMVREGDGLAGRVLAKLGVGLDATRRAVLEMQDNESERKSSKVRHAGSDEGIGSLGKWVWSRLLTTLLDYARWEAEVFEGPDEIEPVHMMIAVTRLNDCVAARVIQSMGVDLIALRHALDQGRRLREAHKRLISKHSKALQKVIKRADENRKKTEQVCTEHVVQALLELGGPEITKPCESVGLTLEKYKSALEKFYNR